MLCKMLEKILFLGFLAFGVADSDIDEHSANNTSYQITARSLDDWCSLTCGPEKYRNIACVMGGQCKAQLPCKFEAIDRRQIVEEHNKLRNRFAAGDETHTSNVQVANLVALDWDDDLAFTASCNLARCGIVDQDLCHTTPTFKDSSGQNLWTYTLKTQATCDCVGEAVGAVKQWYNELQSVTEDEIREVANSYQFNSKLSHFTQVIWAETTHVGCALITNDVDNVITCIMACNYGPGGNIQGARMFEEGRPCSQCGDDIRCGDFYDALCGDGIFRSHTDDPRSNIDLLFVFLLWANCFFMK